MAILEFENCDEAALTLLVEPWGHQHQVSHLARAGIRYWLPAGAEDRSYCAVSSQQIELWIDAASYEIDIVPPSPSDMLMWDICVRGGWCGGIVDGAPTHVIDLLPTSGLVTAESFAELTIRADGKLSSEPLNHDHLRWLEAKFIEHLGSSSAEAEVLRRTARRPFDSHVC